MSRQTRTPRLVVCVRNDGYPVDLELRKVYRALPDRDAESDGMIRVIDESGEDYLFPAEYFVPIRVSPATRQALLFERAEAPHPKRRQARSAIKSSAYSRRVPRRRTG